MNGRASGPRSSRLRTGAGLLAAAVAVTLAAGCASSASGGSGGSGSAAKGPIIFGGLAGTTGAYAAAGTATINGAKLAVQQINAKGGLLGRQVKFVWYNDAFSSTLDTQYFEHLVSQGAVGISGSPSEGPTAAALASRYKLPVIGDVGAGGTTIYPKGPGTDPLPWAFSNSPSTFAMAQEESKFAAAHCDSIGIFYGNDTYSPSENTIFKQTFAAAGKADAIKVDQEVTENLTTGATVPLASEVAALKSSGAQCVYIGLDPQDDGSFVVNMHNAGVHPKYVIGGDTMLATDTYPKLAGSLANGTYSVAEQATVAPNAAAKKFVSDYQAQFSIAPVIYGYAAYDGVMMLAQAIKKAGSTKNTDILAQLNQMTGFPGVMGTLSLSTKNHTTDSTSTQMMVQYSTATKTWAPVPSS
jgi:branched-chain amino acid transport system substrate-binding protein